ncbi:MAG: hypothetical protein JJE35_04880 [Thermoleophilia bacterium]|nr:hypothetical protein [Thermoleophilia bacterium]
MIRNLKVLGLAAMAVLAIGAVGASAASAANFTAAEYPAIGSGAQSVEHEFNAAGVEVNCSTAKFASTLNSASETLTIAPTYSGCKGFFGVSATVTGFGAEACDYTFHSNGEVDLDCAEGTEVTIESSPCTVHIPGQTGLSSNTFTNNTPSAGKVTVDTEVSGIHGVMTRNNFLCPGTAGTFTNGTYTGTTVMEAKNGEGGAVSIDVG